MSKLTKIYSVTVTAVTIAVMLIAAAVVLPRLFGISCYAVKSGSMEPALHVGALTYINTNNTSPDVGDVAVYKIVQDGSETLVMHRVTARTEVGYRFKGDANKNSDASEVMQEQIVGTYILQIPTAGFVLMHCSRSATVMIIILLALLNVSVILLERHASKNEKGDKIES